MEEKKDSKIRAAVVKVKRRIKAQEIYKNNAHNFVFIIVDELIQF